MLETYFVRLETVERIRASWIGSEVEQYANWLADQGYGARTVWRRVPQVLAFGEYARERGAHAVADLPAHVDPYVRERVIGHRGQRSNGTTAQQVAKQVAKEVRGPLEQLLRATISDRIEFARSHPAVIRILVQEAPFHPEILDSLSGIGSRMLTLIDRFQRTGEVDPALRPATVARLIFSAIVSHLLARVFVRLRDDDEPRSIDETVQVLVRRLAPARNTARRDPT